MKQITRQNIYIAPDGFLDAFDEKVLAMASARRVPRVSMVSKISLAAAAVVCSLTAGVAYKLSTPEVSESQVMQAFYNLSEDDRAYLVESCQNDIFLNL